MRSKIKNVEFVGALTHFLKLWFFFMLLATLWGSDKYGLAELFGISFAFSAGIFAVSVLFIELFRRR